MGPVPGPCEQIDDVAVAGQRLVFSSVDGAQVGEADGRDADDEGVSGLSPEGDRLEIALLSQIVAAG